MSKALSNHFHGTTGERKFNNNQKQYEDDIIKDRVRGLDLREHPVKHKSSLSIKEIKRRIKDHTATKEDYRKYDRIKRLSVKRKTAVNDFWVAERERLSNNIPGTRNWTAEQRKIIIDGGRPKVDGKTMQGHHTYSVSMYPHLAGKHEVIFPVTFEEHLYEWHGGNFKNSLPGKPFKRKRRT
jgi:hypothetical protein